MNEITDASSMAVPGLWLMMLKSFGMLCIVLAILAAILFVFKQLTERRKGRINKNLIAHIASFHIGPKEKLMLIDAAGKKLLIGITPQRINTLAEYETAGPEAPLPEGADESFRGILERVNKRPEIAEGDGVKDAE